MRLSDGNLRGECVNLKTKIYDVADRKKMYNRIKAEKRLVQIEELNVVDRVEKIYLQRQSDKNQGLHYLPKQKYRKKIPVFFL